jgi:hypothetical protein
MAIAVRILAAVVGVGLLGLVVDAAVVAAGGYGMPTARLMIGLAAGIAVGALAVGLAWEEGRRRIALCLVVALLAGEAWTLLQTAERTLAHRDQQQVPLRDAADARVKAVERVKAAEAALAAVGETPRLVKAQAAKDAADAAVVARAAEKSCAANCRQLLQAQVDAAAAEVAAARAEIEGVRAMAAGRLKQARPISRCCPCRRAPRRSRIGWASRAGVWISSMLRWPASPPTGWRRSSWRSRRTGGDVGLL